MSGAGAGGNAGTGHGGNSGAGGSGGATSCDELMALAGTQLADAQACNVATDALPCTGKVSNLCGCEIPVHRPDSAETQAYLATLQRLKKMKCAAVCLDIACFPVGLAVCRPTATGSVVGTCVATQPIP